MNSLLIIMIVISFKEAIGWGGNIVHDPLLEIQIVKEVEQTMTQINQAATMLNYVGDPRGAGVGVLERLGGYLIQFDYDKQYKKLESDPEEEKKLYAQKAKMRDRSGRLIARDKEANRASELQANEYKTMMEVEKETKTRRMALEERRRKIDEEASKAQNQSELQQLQIKMASLDSELKQLDALDEKAGKQVIARNAMNEKKKRDDEKSADEEFCDKLEKDRQKWASIKFKRPEIY